jgi:hypothetical protein
MYYYLITIVPGGFEGTLPTFDRSFAPGLEQNETLTNEHILDYRIVGSVWIYCLPLLYCIHCMALDSKVVVRLRRAFTSLSPNPNSDCAFLKCQQSTNGDTIPLQQLYRYVLIPLVLPNSYLYRLYTLDVSDTPLRAAF